MKAERKERHHGSLCRGEIQITVSTTVVEVGVNVPNATVMIVENANVSDWHGLSASGQGRPWRTSVLLYFHTGSDAKGNFQASEILNKSNDDFTWQGERSETARPE